MTQPDLAWGSEPSARYSELAGNFRGVFREIASSSIQRETEHQLPFNQILKLRHAGFTRLRIPKELGGFGATIPELFSLILELGQADPNITNAFRSHTGFVEDLLNLPEGNFRNYWIKKIVEGDMIGSGYSETGNSRLTSFSTTFRKDNDEWVVNGRKYYTTGSLYSDWINLAGVNESGELIMALVPTNAKGVKITDDWDGFGQKLSASGTAIFDNVRLSSEYVRVSPGRFLYSSAFQQNVHIATLAGIARAASEDLTRLVSARNRVYNHGNAERTGDDPQILQIVGAVRAAAYGAGAVSAKVSESLQRAYDSREASSPEYDRLCTLADIEVNQSVRVVSDLVLNSTTQLFDALGASAVKKEHLLDRHWRNARTLVSHNPRIFRDRLVGDFAVNGTRPLIPQRIEKA